jgi:hypothetical protein
MNTVEIVSFEVVFKPRDVSHREPKQVWQKDWTFPCPTRLVRLANARASSTER